MTTKTAQVKYVFKEYSLSVEVVVSLTQQNFTAADNKKYPGYAIQSGIGQYVPPGTTKKLTFQVAPQSVNHYNVIWATSGSGSGGSCKGIDTNGIDIMRDNGALSWNGSGLDFWIQEGVLSNAVNLASVSGWPPRS